MIKCVLCLFKFHITLRIKTACHTLVSIVSSEQTIPKLTVFGDFNDGLRNIYIYLAERIKQKYRAKLVNERLDKYLVTS